jgi:hypothetical protein
MYDKKKNKKFTQSWKLEDYEILTDSGYVDLEYLHETIPYEVWKIKLENGYELECADEHILFDSNMNEIFCKDLKIGDYINTDQGNMMVISISCSDISEPMYDFQLSDKSDRRYYTNGILSHNTELSKQLAKYLFDSEDNMIRLDMSEYQDKISVNRLIGAASGYVGYDDTTVLDKIRQKPYSVILLDEIEKAHPDVFNLFLQVFDDGHMTDSHGRKVSFKNCVILMTSNVGVRMVKDFGTGVGFKTLSQSKMEDDQIKATLQRELHKKFSPEFLNRIDEIIYFKDLEKEDLEKIFEIELVKSINKAAAIGYKLILTKELKNKLVEVGYDSKSGARPMKRAIQSYVDDPITEKIIDESPEIGKVFIVDFKDDKTDITISDEVLPE